MEMCFSGKWNQSMEFCVVKFALLRSDLPLRQWWFLMGRPQGRKMGRHRSGSRDILG